MEFWPVLCFWSFSIVPVYAWRKALVLLVVLFFFRGFCFVLFRTDAGWIPWASSNSSSLRSPCGRYPSRRWEVRSMLYHVLNAAQQKVSWPARDFATVRGVSQCCTMMRHGLVTRVGLWLRLLCTEVNGMYRHASRKCTYSTRQPCNLS